MSIPAEISGIAGWLDANEARLLYELARLHGGTIVEIGSYQGRSTVALAIGARERKGARVWSIDPHEWGKDPHPVHGDLAEYTPDDNQAFWNNIVARELGHVVRAITLPSAQAARAWDGAINLLFIDGLHEYEHVKQDFELWGQHLAPDGMVAFHDTPWPGPGRLINELVASGQWEVAHRADQTTVLKRAAVIEPLVSVLIPAYNAALTVGRAIVSAMYQEGVKVEVIVTDDASTDTTAETAELNGARVLRHATNQGVSAALNTAADAATGRYIIELDADDWLEPGALKALVSAMQADAGFAYGKTRYHGRRSDVYAPPPFAAADFERHNASLYAVMVRRDVYPACQWDDAAGRLGVQDWDFVRQLIRAGLQGVAVDALVLNYVYANGLNRFNVDKADEIAAFMQQKYGGGDEASGTE